MGAWTRRRNGKTQSQKLTEKHGESHLPKRSEGVHAMLGSVHRFFQSSKAMYLAQRMLYGHDQEPQEISQSPFSSW